MRATCTSNRPSGQRSTRRSFGGAIARGGSCPDPSSARRSIVAAASTRTIASLAAMTCQMVEASDRKRSASSPRQDPVLDPVSCSSARALSATCSPACRYGPASSSACSISMPRNVIGTRTLAVLRPAGVPQPTGLRKFSGTAAAARRAGAERGWSPGRCSDAPVQTLRQDSNLRRTPYEGAALPG